MNGKGCRRKRIPTWGFVPSFPWRGWGKPGHFLVKKIGHLAMFELWKLQN